MSDLKITSLNGHQGCYDHTADIAWKNLLLDNCQGQMGK